MESCRFAPLWAACLLCFASSVWGQAEYLKIASFRFADQVDAIPVAGIVDQLPDGGSLVQVVRVQEEEEGTYIPVSLDDMAKNGINTTGLADRNADVTTGTVRSEDGNAYEGEGEDEKEREREGRGGAEKDGDQDKDKDEDKDNDEGEDKDEGKADSGKGDEGDKAGDEGRENGGQGEGQGGDDGVDKDQDKDGRKPETQSASEIAV